MGSSLSINPTHTSVPLAKPRPDIIIATDCGSTTTKAICIERDGSDYRLRHRGEAPTTVENPFADVTIGVLNSMREVEEVAKLSLIKDGKVHTPQENRVGADVYVSTSSAGGGLQMLVMGVIREMSAESAQRAALGAGAIVLDTIAINDGFQDYERVAKIRELRPDMILLSGGTNGGTKKHVVEMAELLVAAGPKPRLGMGHKLPVIYAGNEAVQKDVEALIGKETALQIIGNIRPALDIENLREARGTVHDIFLEHVMQQAPGYPKLMDWVSAPIMPTPLAVGYLVEKLAKDRGISVLAVDIGGATTDVFSVFSSTFNRTVSANLGMSYSMGNVLKETGVANIQRWLPFEINDREMKNGMRNKMIRPTTIPQTQQELYIEQAIAREALRLALEHHKSLAVELRGFQTQRNISDVFNQQQRGKTLVDMMALDLIIGSGGVISHAPSRIQAALMLVDAFQPEGFTNLAVDSIFMMPHLGVLASVYPEVSMQVFEQDCLIPLGACLAPKGKIKLGQLAMTVTSPTESWNIEVKGGELKRIDLPDKEIEIIATPTSGLDLGAGNKKPIRKKVSGGKAGLILDCRGRPIVFSPNNLRASHTKELYNNIGLSTQNI